MSQLIESGSSFRALAEGSATQALLSANLGGESLRSSDLNWVKIPTGGATRWSWSTKSGAEHSEKAIAGLLVVVGRTESVLWPHSDATAGSRPLLMTDDGRVAIKTGQDYGDLDQNVIEAAKNPDGTYNVSKIPYFQWEGRGPGSKPPRAKSTRVIGVLREEDNLPIFIRVSQTSLRAVDDLLRGITAEGLFHYRAVVELSLEKRKGARADYAVLVAKKVGEISEEQGRVAKAKITDVMSPIVCPPVASRGMMTVTAAVEAAASEAVPF
jgi:hypothetical protein